MRRSSRLFPALCVRLRLVSMKLFGLFAVFLLVSADWTVSGVSHPKPACRYPPSQWCRSLEIAVECKVQKQCMELSAISPNKTVPPVSVVVYCESLCPDCRVFINRQLFPTWLMLKNIMSVTFVPYGNAQEVQSTNSRFVCQHGERECKGNMIQACILHLVDNSIGLHIIYCMVSSADVLSAAQPCLQLYAPSCPWSSVESCVHGDQGYRLMHANGVMTRALSPTITETPWVTFDGEYTEENKDRANFALFRLICDLYKGVKPPACTGAPVILSKTM